MLLNFTGGEFTECIQTTAAYFPGLDEYRVAGNAVSFSFASRCLARFDLIVSAVDIASVPFGGPVHRCMCLYDKLNIEPVFFNHQLWSMVADKVTGLAFIVHFSEFVEKARWKAEA